jgi:DNA topoisomerase-2
MIQVAAAGRYTRVKLNSDFLQYFTDFDILDQNEDPENPEPLCYLPTIPWVLVNGIEGIAVGFSTYILPRDPEKLKQYIKDKLKGKKTDYDFEPYYKDFKGMIYKLPNSNSWVMEGCFERLSNSVVKITELPVGFDREKYIAFLEKLYEKKKIKDYDENCKTGFEFMIKVNKDMEDEEILKLLRIDTTLTENIVVIDNEGKLREFETPEKLVDYFIKYRLGKYQERIIRNIKLSENEIAFIDEKKRFIELILNREIYLTKITKEDLLNELTKRNFVFKKALIETQIYKFTKDELEKLEERKIELNNYIEQLRNTTAEAEWIKEL